LLGFALASSAATAEVYIGAGAGLGFSNAASQLGDYWGYTSTDTKDKHQGSGSLYGGFAFSKTLALELSYIDFGKYEISGRIGALASADQVSAQAVTLGVVGSIPLGPQFGMDGKLGLSGMTQKYHCIAACTSLPDTSKTQAVAMIGGGVYWTPTASLTIRGRYEYFGGGKFNIKNSVTGASSDVKANFSLLSANIEYHF
jgi:opacity protein-like surface antigen